MTPPEEVLEISYENWIVYVFEGDPDDKPMIVLSNKALAEYLAMLFESPQILLNRYPKNQIANGLGYIGSISSEWFWDARSVDVPIDLQVRWILAIFPLYRELFAPLCNDTLDYDPSTDLLESTLFLFWDRDCLEGAAMFPEEQHSEHLVDPIFEVLTDILTLDHLLCQQSALHGLGHLYHWNEERVPTIIDRYIETHTDIPEKLMQYAREAREGDVL